MKKLSILLVSLSVLLVACKPSPLPENAAVAVEKASKSTHTISGSAREIVITNVVRVFLHEPPHHYSVMSRGKDKKLILHDLNMLGEVSVYEDVPAEKSMWATYVDNVSISVENTAEIHVHSVSEINGAGWAAKRGKQTVNGTTVVVE